MRQLVAFQKNYDHAVNGIHMHLQSGYPEFVELVNLLLTTDANPYGFCPTGYTDAFYSAQSFDSLCCAIHHALYDDGDITFYVVGNEPRFGFFCRHELTDENCLNSTEKHFVKTRGNVYNYRSVTIQEWILLFNEFHDSEVRRYFISDAVRHGIEFAVSSNDHYARFDPDWVFDEEILKEIATNRQTLIDCGMLDPNKFN